MSHLDSVKVKLNEDLDVLEEAKQTRNLQKEVRIADNLIEREAENRERIKLLKTKLEITVSRCAELKTISFMSRNELNSKDQGVIDALESGKYEQH